MSRLEVIFKNELSENDLKEIVDLFINTLADDYVDDHYIPLEIHTRTDDEYFTNWTSIKGEEIDKKYKESLEINEKINLELRKTKIIKPNPEFNYPKDYGKLYPFDE